MAFLWVRRLVALFSRARLDRELREEMEGHIELRRTALVAEGMDPRAADAAARRLFGNATVLRERTREMWGFPAAESVVMDVRYGLRSLRRSPVFTAVAVLSIAGGLAAGTGIFAVMNAIVYRSIGVGDGQSLYRIFTSDHSGGSLYSSSSYPDFEAFREATDVIASACATERVRANLVVNGAAAMHHGEVVSPGCFDALKLSPPLGRYFSEHQAAESAVPLVISHSLFARRFDGDSSVVGRTVLLNGMSVTVIGVAPKGFAGTSLDGGAEFWAPIQVAPVVFPPGALRDRRQRMFTIFARLRGGVGREQAEAALAVVASRLQRLDAPAWTTAAGGTRKVTVLRETEARFAGAPAGATAGIFASVIVAIGLIVAIACLNLATMLLARGASRAREISIRLAIGAARGRVLRQLATESLIIAVLGAALAIALVSLGIRLFEAYRPAEVPAFDVAIDWRVLTFATVLAMAAALVFGLAPATHTLRLALTEGLKGRLFAARVRRIRVSAREALIVLQVAVSIALLLVSTLFVRAMAGGATVSPGFNGAGVSVIQAHLDAVADSEVAAVTERLLEAAASVPGVSQASLAGIVPLSGSNIGFAMGVNGDSARSFLGNVVSSGYFATLEIPIRAGRDFDRRDRAGGAPSVIVSETFARSVWGTPNVIGRSLIHDGRRVDVVNVVGVVADTRYRSLSEPFQPLVYLPIGQTSATRFFIHARVRDGQTLATLDAAIRAVDRRVAIEGATPLRAQIDRAMAGERAAQWAGGIVGIVQLGLAVMALWGLVAYAVERRTAEMGVRLALGATPSSLVRLAMRPAGVAIVAGVAIGCVLGATVAKIVQAASVALAPLDLVAVIPVAAIFTVVAMTSAWWPARRAGLADPAASLRRE
jgi:predicted permease